MARLLDAFAFSSGLVACAAAALAAAAARALGLTPDPAVLVLAACGTVVVYCVDRVRDLPRDGGTSPLRSAFVRKHRGALLAAAALAGGGALAAGAVAGPRVVALAAAVAALGLWHRRLKRFAWAKPVYLTTSWIVVTAGFPAAAASAPPRAELLAVVALVLGACVQSNVILSNLRDAEGLAARLGARRARATAAGLCGAALALALLGPASSQRLAALPVATALAIARFQPDERYGALVVDGALLAGALAAIALPG